MGFSSETTPQRSAATRVSTTEVARRFGGLTETGKAGRAANVSERRPFAIPRPSTRK
jgi:hypothetical protein